MSLGLSVRDPEGRSPVAEQTYAEVDAVVDALIHYRLISRAQRTAARAVVLNAIAPTVEESP